LAEGGFLLYCQNIVPLAVSADSTQTKDTHYEILLRMRDDDGKIVRPASFIAAAERYHLMPAIDRWVVTEALQLLSERRQRGEVNGIFAINVSGQSLDDDEFLGFVVDKLHHSDVSPEMICFEITETVAATNLTVVQRFMSILRGMGCRFALDDFGRGISSFAYLKNLKVDYLKIDGMFVKDLAEDEVGHAMVESINHIGHIMGMQTIAEFVESKEVLEKLIALGVDHVQGYELGRPHPLQPAFRSGAIH
jgi:EAL domain-containing protein (putative c-di-GMP-specific phosphodiesterase class I)